jgi:hypothetical protein
MGEGESDDNGRERAPSSSNDQAHIDRNLAVSGLRRHDGTVETAGRKSVSDLKSQCYLRQNERNGTYPDLDGKAEALVPCLISVASMSLAVWVLLGTLDGMGEVMKDVRVCV